MLGNMSPETALPSVRARIIAFVAIFLGGGLGGAIGYWFADIQCTGSCTTVSGFSMLGGTLLVAVGTAVISVLSLRALAEWTASGR